jgi:hypothetical protein
MKKIFAFIVLLGLTLLLIYSCKKEEDPNPPKEKLALRFSKDALSYVNIPVGRYFIYKDSATLQLDSVVVMASKLQTLEIPAFSGIGSWGIVGYPAYSTEKFDIRLASWKNGFTSDWLTASSELYYNILGSPVKDTGSVNLRTQKNMVFYQTHTGTKTYHVTVEGKDYFDVNVTKDNNGYEPTNPLYYESTYYWVKNIGVIKRIIKDGTNPVQTVYLIRYN